jgi:hypothetical protein
MKNTIFTVILGCALTVVLYSISWAEVTPVPLANSDCLKCHLNEVKDVDALGAKHKTDVGCLDCHLEHPKLGKEVIPECSMCHDPGDKPHYATPDCKVCHHPHHPLMMDFTKIDNVKPACASCHTNESQQMVDYPSMHADLDCNQCHLEHKQFEKCMECHEGHSQEMAYEDCLRCHKPHMASVVKYENDIPSSFCSSCHEKESSVLGKNTTKHHDLLCVYCHKSQHKMVPTCAICHSQPHSVDMHTKFPDCHTCHKDPHDLVK